ncbi:TPA: gp58-like family protein [Streptococcus equi subsp. zooepidemicus]|uniref:gp58-like family protein n=1 Tax=Streptococcus equi TaxID=1336 RepID=UPI001E35A185|nr:gp58-like family protein [Streptococcus equi]MCD3386922.1 gp58-like family protein [Streptococcus equi subsp. zooepidemicus]HEL0238356.1 gp58-like family protein [Streptococcus equi subsp. zooepidemicus]HEL0587779.1 gp58-like family protein [Streptococcus equi subsp. zooepidemicus]HEL0616957.1 gp58-like family protein [Streptococcus equi subsp. zooepidemicus]HEL1071106.1 gp58-like family protein [Streptococcus equi subsp. zooepidemicus]
MSRDPTLMIDESNLVIGQDGRMHYTFTAQDDNQKVRLKSSCLGTAHFNQLMIERGDKATDYVAPVVVEGTGQATGLFKDLKEISLELTDTQNSKLWSKIKLTTNGMLREYHHDHISAEIVETAAGIAKRISDDTGQKLALINETIKGVKREYQDADRQLSSSYQAGIEGLKAQLANDKIGLQAEIKLSAQGLSQKYDDELRTLYAKITTTSSGTTEAYESKLEGLRAEFTRSNQGMRVELESQISGLRAVQQSTAKQISQEIKDRTGAVSRVQQDLNSYQRQLQDAEKNYSSLTQTVKGLQSTVSDPRNGVESRLTQLNDLIKTKVSKGDVETTIAQSYDKIALAIRDKLPASKMTGSEIISAINLDRSGVKITGKNITLDGNSYISNAVIKDAHIANMDAGKINTGYLNGNRIATETITGDKIKFDYAFFNKLTANEGYFRTLFAKDIFATSVQSVTLSASKITGGVLAATNGASRWNLNTADIDFNRNATINFNSSNNALMRKKGESTGFLHFNDDSYGGVYVGLGVTSNYEGIKSQNTIRFAGIRVFRPNESLDRLELYGDSIHMSHGFDGGGSLTIKFTDFKGKDVNLATIFNKIFENFRTLNDLGRFSGASGYWPDW